MDREVWFETLRRRVADFYLSDPADEFRQSGRSAGAERWFETRHCLVEAIDRSGHFMDIGCANGLLLDTLIEWLGPDGLTIVPHGIDFVPELIELARRRHPDHVDNFSVANVWDWAPDRRYDYVRTNVEYVPDADRASNLRRLFDETVGPGGRLIVCHYVGGGNQTDDIAGLMRSVGLDVSGTTRADGVAVAWVDAPGRSADS
ncbi:MAG: methyltransferase domain-containing protein [Acidimicrobiia bacterium]|nr:methyltransferase domain-containing protein [Acidimicrobiia bacterium]